MASVLTADNVFESAEPTTYLGPESNGMRMTSEEFEAVDDAERGYRYELIQGTVIVSPPPSPGSRGPNDELGYWLRRYQEEHPKGKALDATLPENYIRARQDWRIADRAIWCELGRLPDPEHDVPTIAVEFVSAGSRNRHRDYVEKRNQYLEAGVQEYWIIDRFRRSLTVVFADGTERVLRETSVYKTPLLPGFELDLERLLQIADRWVK